MPKKALKTEETLPDRLQATEAPEEVSQERLQPETVAEPVQEKSSLKHLEKGGKKRALSAKALRMRDKLHAEKKVRIIIPLNREEKHGVTQSVILNGYPMYILKGVYVDVPESVADVLEEKMNHRIRLENHPDKLKGDGTINLQPFGG